MKHLREASNTTIALADLDRGFRTFVDTSRVVTSSDAPEPAVYSLLALGLIGLGLSKKKRA
ncbi:MAG: PEP-CTERM sorting domain-containing protein [Hahellaceae bacterium]|nr:PEP-CTERM sorting domain-containing protein [Hahellaceae bacterium]MCP5209671.1 PEP-CTERM sorting domain-containing protein [Hahellaceae bacterium]